MSNREFIIEILDLHWLKPDDNDDDLCVHGRVYLKIGDSVLANKESGDWTLSSTALYLLRTLEYDYIKDDISTQILPCCGHTLIPDDDNQCVIIQGCNIGIDWQIMHDGNNVKLILEDGSETIVEFNQYKKTVLDFADKIEEFYNTSLPRIIPDDEYDRKGYRYFWEEWRTLRDKW